MVKLLFFHPFLQVYSATDTISLLQVREVLSKFGDLQQTQIFAKIENVEVI